MTPPAGAWWELTPEQLATVRAVEDAYDKALAEGDACPGCARDADGKRIWGPRPEDTHGPDCPYLLKHGQPRADGTCGCAECTGYRGEGG